MLGVPCQLQFVIIQDALCEFVSEKRTLVVQGPHFMDWSHYAGLGAVSMASVPLSLDDKPVAALSISSTAEAAMPCDDTLSLLGALVAPHTAHLKYTCRSAEVERLVHHIVTPLAAELTVQQGRFKRIKNADGEEILCLDDTRGPQSSQTVSATTSRQVVVKCSVETQAEHPFRILGSDYAASLMLRLGSVAPPRASQRDAPSAHSGDGEQQNNVIESMQRLSTRVYDAVLGEVFRNGPAAQKLAPPSRNICAPDVMDHIDFNWSDFMFNLISMCIIYAYFSKGAGPHVQESFTAVLLCMAVAAFDILLLLLRYDHYLNYGLVLCVFQVYRVLLLPFANTWMLWSLVNKLELRIATSMWIGQGLLLGACYLLSFRLRSLLHVPVQLVTVCFSASTAVHCCWDSDGDSYGGYTAFCVLSVLLLQIVLGIIVPSLIMLRVDSSMCRSFIPHAQAKRSVCQN